MPLAQGPTDTGTRAGGVASPVTVSTNLTHPVSPSSQL